jgi:hypothetical protein
LEPTIKTIKAVKTTSNGHLPEGGQSEAFQGAVLRNKNPEPTPGHKLKRPQKQKTRTKIVRHNLQLTQLQPPLFSTQTLPARMSLTISKPPLQANLKKKIKTKRQLRPMLKQILPSETCCQANKSLPLDSNLNRINLLNSKPNLPSNRTNLPRNKISRLSSKTSRLSSSSRQLSSSSRQLSSSSSVQSTRQTKAVAPKTQQRKQGFSNRTSEPKTPKIQHQ